MDTNESTDNISAHIKTPQSKGMEVIVDEANRILELAMNPATTNWPEDLFNYRTGNMLSIFLEIKVMAFGLSSLHAGLMETGREDMLQTITAILLAGYVAHDLGLQHYAKEKGLELDFVKEHLDFGELVEEGMPYLANEFAERSHVIYYTLALAQACNFNEKFKKSFIKKSSPAKETMRSLYSVVDSAGHLLSAQSLFRRGLIAQQMHLSANELQNEIKAFQEKFSVQQSEMITDALAADRSARGKKAATARHAENHAMKADAMAYYEQNRHKFKSKDAAAEAIAGRIVPMTFRVVRGWITEYHKKQSTRTM